MCTIEPPCYDCKSRTVGCHGKCKKYMDFKNAVEVTKNYDSGETDLRAYTKITHRRIIRRAAPSQRRLLK